MKIGLIVLTYLFSFWGLIFGLLIQIIYLVNLKSFPSTLTLFISTLLAL